MLLTAITSVRVSGQEADPGDARSSQSGSAVLKDGMPPSRPAAARDPDQGVWDFGYAYAFVRFNSSTFRASTSGLLSSVGYHFTNHFALEGQVTATFGDPKPGPYDAKYLFYGAGPAVSTGGSRTRLFVQNLFGGVHLLPQTAYNKNGLAMLAGCGSELKLKPRIWIRVEADYVRSQLYRSGQNNMQLGIGMHYRFSATEKRP